MKHLNIGRAMALGLLSITASVQAAEFRGLGDLTSTQRESTGNAVSGDGSVAVGRGMSSGPEAFQWRQGSMNGLGALSTRPRESCAYGVSGNGSLVVGASAASTQGPQAFIWTESGGMQGLGYLSSYRHSEALGVSPDGQTVAGYGMLDGGVTKAFQWTAGTGMVALSDLAGGIEGSRAAGAGAGIVAGESWGANGLEATRWIDGMAYGLGDLEGGGFQSAATAIAGNGLGIVGYGWSGNGFEAFLWRPGGDLDIRNPNAPGGMIGLGDLAGGAFSSAAMSVSDNGFVVGRGTTAMGTEAFLWSQASGMRRLADVLTGEGLDLAGWTLTSANGISRDGSTIVGTGIDPTGKTQAWMARVGVVPEPGTFAALGLGALAFLRQRRKKGGR